MAGAGFLAGADVTKIDENEQFKPGMRTRAITKSGEGTAEFVYVQAKAALAQGKAYVLGAGYACDTGLVSASAGQYACIPQVAITSAYHGWGLVDGDADYIYTLSAAAANTALYTSGTAGAFDDTSASQARAEGLVTIDAVATAAGATAGSVIGPLKIA